MFLDFIPHLLILFPAHLQVCTDVTPQAFIKFYWDAMKANPVCTPINKITQPGWWAKGRLLVEQGGRALTRALTRTAAK